MIPKAYIIEWQKNAPWQNNAQVEQDLIIERALIELFSDEMIRAKLAFRGGTALHKIHYKPQVRYSEDIDLVQREAGNIGDILTKVREKLSFIDDKARFRVSGITNRLSFRFESEIPPTQRLRLKIEINSREHFQILGWNEVNLKLESTWFKGNANIVTYKLEELLGTKLRALYQRSKGRDLFDLYYALSNSNINIEEVVHCYHEYLERSNETAISSEEFIENMDEKMQDDDFKGDINSLLRPTINYNVEEAYQLVRSKLLDKI